MSALSLRLARLPRDGLAARAAEATSLGLVLVAAAYAYTRNRHSFPNYDEGNYLGSLDALRHGQALGRDVFLDQPPGWYLLLVAVSYPFGNSVAGVRTGLLVVTLVALLAAYACGRLAAGAVGGVLAAGVMAVARPLPQFAGLVESEPASAALAAAAVALAVYAYRDRLRPWAAAASGCLLAASTAVKLPGATAALPIGALAILCGTGSLRRRLALPAAGAAGVVLVLVVAYRNALSQIYHGVFVTHTRILGEGTGVSNLDRAARFVDPRTPFGLLVIGGAVASIVVARRGPQRRLLAALWLWAVGGYGFILAMHPLSDHHFVFLAVSLALPAGVGVGLAVNALQPRRAAAVAAVAVAIVAIGFVKNAHETSGGVVARPPAIDWAVAQLAAHTAPGDLVVSDLPLVPYLAGRRMPGQLIDTSIARIAYEDLTPAGVLRIVDDTRPTAVIVGRMFQTKPAIVAGVRRRYAHRLHRPLAIGGYIDIFYGRR